MSGDPGEATTSAIKKLKKLFIHPTKHEREPAENGPRQQSEFLNVVLESLTHPFYVIDANDYTIKLANSATGFSELEETSTCYALAHRRDKPCDSAECPCPLAIVKKTKKHARVEHTHYDEHGAARVYAVHCHPVFDEKGEVAEVVEYTIDITERKNAEEEIREAKESYDRILDNADEAVFRVGAQGGHISYVNPAAERMFGYSLAEWLADPDLSSKIIHPDFVEKQKQIIEEINTSKKPIKNAVLGWMTKDGHEIIVEYTIIPIMDEEGNVVCFESIGRDITERKRAEAALRESEQRYRTLFEAATEAIFVARVEEQGLGFMNCNLHALSMFGSSREEILARTPLDFSPPTQPDGRSSAEAAIEKIQAVLDGEPQFFEWQHSRADGTVFDTEITLSPIELGGEPHVMGIVYDITERKQTEEALRESEDRYRALFEQAGNSVVLVDVETGDLVEFNDMAHESLGYTREEFETLRISDTEVTETAEDVANHIEKIVRDGADSFETQHRTKDGEILDIVVNSRVISLHGKGYILSVWLDITERKRAEEETREAKESYDRILDNADEAVFRVGAQGGHVVYANPAAERMFGYSLAEWLADPDLGSKTIHPDYVEKRKQIIEKINTGKKPIKNAVLGWIAKDGREVIAEYTMIPIMDEEGNVVSFESIGRDITERERVQEALRGSERQLSTIYESVGDVLYFLAVEPDDCFRFLSINQAFLDATGLTEEQIVGKPIEEVIPEPSVRMVRDNYKRAIEENRIVRWQETSEYPAGVKIGEVSIAPVFNDDGVCAYLVGSVHDVTESKRAEEAVRESGERFRQLAEHIPEVFWIGSPDWREVFYVSPAYERIIGRSCDSLYAQPLSWLDAVVEEDREKITAGVARISSGDFSDPRAAEFRIARPDGSIRWIRARAFPILNEHGEPYRVAGTAEDITDRKKAEDEISASEAKFQDLYDNAPDMFVSVDAATGIILVCNETLARATGYTKEEIIGSVKKGIYCESFTNGEVHIGPGDFTFYVKNGNLIEDGKISRPIKDINIIGNGPEILKRMVMVADDLEMSVGSGMCGKGGQSVPVSMGLPTTKVSAITVGGINS